MGRGGVEGTVLFYNVIRKFVLCREDTKTENHFKFENNPKLNSNGTVNM